MSPRATRLRGRPGLSSLDGIRSRTRSRLLFRRREPLVVSVAHGAGSVSDHTDDLSRRARRDRAPALRRPFVSRELEPLEENESGAPRAARSLGAGAVSRPHAVVIGGGLAGLAAATALAPSGWRVTILESKGRLGGRAGSFTDPATGQVIDACQHVSMGCCTNFAHFCRMAGIDHLLAPQKTLYFMTPDRRVSRFRAGWLPAPLHLARSFLRVHFLTLAEKLQVARVLVRLVHEPADADPPFLSWLQAHGQTPRTIELFWSVVLVSALNETIDRVGLKYARKVFRDAFWSDRRGFEIQIPAVPLD